MTSSIIGLLAILVLCSPEGRAQTADDARGDRSSEETFTTTRRDKKPPSQDKSMGFGDRLRALLAEKRRKAAEAQPVSDSIAPATAPPDRTMEGYLAIEREDYEAAGNYLEQARYETLDPTDADEVLELFELYALLAYEIDEEGDHETAQEYLDEGEDILFDYLDGEPDEYEVAYVLDEVAYLYYELGNYAVAADYFADAADIDPNSVTEYMAASAYALNGQIETALEYLEDALYSGLLNDYDVDLAGDTDLDDLRDTDRYGELREEFGF